MRATAGRGVCKWKKDAEERQRQHGCDRPTGLRHPVWR